MFRNFSVLLVMVFICLAASGCRNPVKRAPANAFPGSAEYDKRVSSFKITPNQAYSIAEEEARTDNRMQYLSRRPTVIVKRWYVFSLPRASGADLQGYHVNGDTGAVKFVNDKTVIPHSKR